MLNDLIVAIEKYNELQKDESKQLDWWADVLDNIHCITDEKEVKAVLDNLNAEIEKLKKGQTK